MKKWTLKQKKDENTRKMPLTPAVHRFLPKPSNLKSTELFLHIFDVKTGSGASPRKPLCSLRTPRDSSLLSSLSGSSLEATA